ncbi:rcc1 and btb domain-containing protein 1, partial [Lasius niger]
MTQSTSNFTLQVEGQPIHVHKAILKNRSQYFKNKFEHHWKNDQNVLYTIPDKFSYIVYKAFMKYLYTGTVDLPLEQVLELMKLADEYCETNLK